MSASILLDGTGKINSAFLPPIAIAPSAVVVGSASGTLVYNPVVVGVPTPGAPSLTISFTAPYTGLYNIQVAISVPNGTRSTLIDDNGLIQWELGDGTPTYFPYTNGSVKGSDLAQASDYSLSTAPVQYCFNNNVFLDESELYDFNVYAYRGNTPSGVFNLPASAQSAYVN